MHFLDQAKIFVKGGDVIFEAVAGLNTLIDFRYAQHF
jgi:GTPase involved in cell partitioning and DNA repair